MTLLDKLRRRDEGSRPLFMHGATFEQLADDVYYNRDFLALHAGTQEIASLETDTFHHAAVVQPIDGSPLKDMETPWGYGGPIASSAEALTTGLADWRRQQCAEGRIAEFVRLHPFIDPLTTPGLYDSLSFDRTTVLVDLPQWRQQRQDGYDRVTRKRLRKAEKDLTVRLVDGGRADVDTFKRLYESGLENNNATSRYYFDVAYFETLLNVPWATAWIAEYEGEPTAVMVCIHGGIFAHTHLSGGDDRSRALNASALLHHLAIEHYADHGFQWMHLGGGRTNSPDDALFQFKAKFSPLRSNFFLGGFVHDEENFARLGGRDGPLFLGYRSPKGGKADDLPRPMETSARLSKSKDYESLHRLFCQLEAEGGLEFSINSDYQRGIAVFDAALSDPTVAYQTVEFDGQVVAVLEAGASGRTAYLFPAMACWDAAGAAAEIMGCLDGEGSLRIICRNNLSDVRKVIEGGAPR